jgi:hypothetical protein
LSRAAWHATALASVAGAIWLASCGGGTTTRPDLDIVEAPEDSATPPDEEETGDGPPDTDPPDSDPVDTETLVPPTTYECDDPTGTTLDQACDFSVNNAEIVKPGPGEGLMIRTFQSGPNPPGAFNSPAAGNRAIAGFPHYDRLDVAELQSLEFDVEKISGTPVVGPEFTLVVDMTCRGLDIRVVTVPFTALGEPVELGDNRQRYTVLATQGKFAVFGGLEDPTGETTILPDPDYTNGVPFGPLTDLVGAYPDACIRNRDSRQDSLPLGADTSGLMITVGRATNLIKNEWLVWRLKVNDTEHLSP